METDFTWQDYQRAAAALFRDLECDVEIEANVEGARATHKIDVWVVFDVYGLEVRWAIECKLWKTAVTKEKVLALQ